MIYESILDTIGNTPVVKLHRIPPKHVTIYAKIDGVVTFAPYSRNQKQVSVYAVPAIATTESTTA